MTCSNSDSRVPVINLEDGSRLSGDEAPLKKDLDKWLDDHPGFMVDRPDNLEDEDSFLEVNKVDFSFLTGKMVKEALGFKPLTIWYRLTKWERISLSQLLKS